MNEEQAALDFFSQPENLPLALIAADHIDGIRQRLNNEFWLALRDRLEAWLAERALPWSVKPTEDRNAEECLVGLHLEPHNEQRSFLRPFMEQQFLGDNYRMFYGLMWNSAPDAGQKKLPAVEALGASLATMGLKNSESFFAWQWLPWHPRRKDFLLSFANRRDELLDEAMRPWQQLLEEHGELLQQANAALAKPAGVTISLDTLRSKLPSQAN